MANNVIDRRFMDRLKFTENIRPDVGWSIFIDIEGFSSLLEATPQDQMGRALVGLNLLSGALYKIGAYAYPGRDPGNPIERLFIHQFGDGFVIKPDFPEDGLERPFLISIALMRYLICCRVATKTAISFGSISDIQGTYDLEVRRNSKGGVANIGNGIMTTSSVLGTAVTRANKLGSREHGAVLIVDRRLGSTKTFPTWIKVSKPDSHTQPWSIVNWIDSNSAEVPLLCQLLGKQADPDDCRSALDEYFQMEPRPNHDWCTSSLTAVQTS